jgi:Icc-related predicted phosphoesterase
MGLFRRSKPRARGLRCFFATDIHGSDQCFRKFLNSAEFYSVDRLILGGDITGKLLIPIVRNGGGRYSCQYGEHSYEDLDDDARRELEKRIRRRGHYPVVDTADELARLEDEGYREEMFRRIVVQSVGDWVTLAEERLGGTGRQCFMAPGNDDFFDVDAALEGSDVVRFAENRVLWLDETHEMITTGYSNPTPWNTERELPEDELKERLNAMAARVANPRNMVAVVHPPPYGTEIDAAPALDEDLRMSMEGGGIRMAPVGSTAVREFIEDVQPLIGLHGHVHEGKGVAQLGRTICINPGSEYSDGVLAGALIEIGDGEVLSHQLVTG